MNNAPPSDGNSGISGVGGGAEGERRVQIQLGAWAEPIAIQLAAQGVSKPPHETTLLQRLSDAITLLGIHGMLPEAEKRRAQKRLLKRIVNIKWEQVPSTRA